MDVVEVDTHWGVFLLPKRDFMVGELSCGYEPEVVEWMQENVKEGMTVANVGANVGYFTVILSYLVGTTGHVHAVEPLPTNVELLKRNTEHLTNITIHPVAGLDQNGVIELYRHVSNCGDNRVFHMLMGTTYPPMPVACRRMDDLIGEVDVALVDAQGVDHMIMRGWGEKKPAKALVEVWPEGIQELGLTVPEAIGVYNDLGYSTKRIGPSDEGHWNLELSVR